VCCSKLIRFARSFRLIVDAEADLRRLSTRYGLLIRVKLRLTWLVNWRRGIPLISQCLNSECRRPLDYLRGGRIVRTEYLVGMCLKLEHFWLCGDCSRCFDFRIFADRPAVAIRCERYSQRFVRTEEAAFPSRGQRLRESVGSSMVMTQLGDGNPISCFPCRQPMLPNRT
jgi:LSD1 subclass zinc finger protein